MTRVGASGRTGGTSAGALCVISPTMPRARCCRSRGGAARCSGVVFVPPVLMAVPRPRRPLDSARQQGGHEWPAGQPAACEHGARREARGAVRHPLLRDICQGASSRCAPPGLWRARHAGWQADERGLLGIPACTGRSACFAVKPRPATRRTAGEGDARMPRRRRDSGHDTPSRPPHAPPHRTTSILRRPSSPWRATCKRGYRQGDSHRVRELKPSGYKAAATSLRQNRAAAEHLHGYLRGSRGAAPRQLAYRRRLVQLGTGSTASSPCARFHAKPASISLAQCALWWATVGRQGARWLRDSRSQCGTPVVVALLRCYCYRATHAA
eukprot:scaffold770_cov107-Isochrysis_galbana.AAC.3